MPRFTTIAIVACTLGLRIANVCRTHELRGRTAAPEPNSKYTRSNGNLENELPILAKPIEYLVEPSDSLPSDKAGKHGMQVSTKAIEKSDMVEHHLHKDQGVLVTLFKGTKGPMNHRDLLLVSEAVDRAGSSKHVPLDEHTHCVCNLRSSNEDASCFCKHQLQPDEEFGATSNSSNDDNMVGSSERIKSTQNSSNVIDEYQRRRQVAAQNTLMIRKRLKQRIDAAEQMRSARVVEEFDEIIGHDSDYFKSLVTPSDSGPEAELDSSGLSEADRRKATRKHNVDTLRATMGKLRDVTAAVRLTRDETLARAREYAQIDDRISKDLQKAEDQSSALAKVVHAHARDAIAKLRSSGRVNVTGILSSMENDTRPILLHWLKMRQNRTLEEQAEKEKQRIATEKHSNEEQKKKLENGMTLEELLKKNEQYKRLQAGMNIRLEEQNKHLQKLEEDQKALKARYSALDEFRNKISPEESSALDEELQKRLAVAERDNREQAYKRTKAAEASAKRRAQGLANRGHPGNINVAAELKKLQVMRERLHVGREELEKEVERRWMMGPGHQNVGHGCVLCKGMEEIEKLEDAIKRLQGELKKCQDTPSQFEPGCDEDLVFQITRLREEVLRRRALLTQESDRLKKEVASNNLRLEECRRKNGGCDAKVEQGLQLLIKRDSDELERRSKAESARAVELVYRCLYEHHVTQEHIPKLFSLDENTNLLSLSSGCNENTKTQLSSNLYKCICSDFAAEKVLVRENINRLNKVQAGAQLASATEEFRKKQEAEEAAMKQKVAEAAEAKLVLNVVQSSPQYHDILTHLRNANINVTETMNDAKVQEENVDAMKAQQHHRLDNCLTRHVEDKNVKNNMRSAFQDIGGVGNKNSAACILLSVSKDPAVKEAHECICTDSDHNADISTTTG